MHGNSSLLPETVSDKVNIALHKIARKPVPSYVPLPAQRHRRHDSKGSRLSVQVSPKPPNALRGVISLWKWEIVSLAVSCVVFIVAIVILRAYENKGLSHWKAPISINAVIAIISTIFKGALIVPISNGLLPFISLSVVLILIVSRYQSVEMAFFLEGAAEYCNNGRLRPSKQRCLGFSTVSNQAIH